MNAMSTRTTTDGGSTSAVRRARRPAAIARVTATGISIAGSLGIVGSLARADQADTSSVTSVGSDVGTTTPDDVRPAASVVSVATTTTVVIEVHRTVYVDEFGNPVEPPPVTVLAPSTASSPVTTAPTRVRTSQPTVSTVPGTSTTVAAPATTVRTPPPPPSCSGSNCP